ncbi:hypothetical protein DYH09_25015 [bacterium CPR1]|nr:hypothetical protein [bacterium CPR1]
MNTVNLPTSVEERLSRFRSQGTLGEGAERTQVDGKEAAIAMMIKLRDIADVTALDQGKGDRDTAPGRLDVAPDVASTVAPMGFGAVSRLVGSFQGEAADPDSATLHFEGQDRSKYYHMESTPNGQGGGQVTFYECLSKGDSGLIQASRFDVSGPGEIHGYAEQLMVPWHLAK